MLKFRIGGRRQALQALQLKADAARHEADGYRAAFETLQADATSLRHDAEGYRQAFETLNHEAGELRQGRDGFQGAYENACAEAALWKDRHQRLLTALEKSGKAKTLPPAGLNGRQLCFLRIPKTASTSVFHALIEAMPDASMFHDSLSEFDDVSADEVALSDVVSGHFTYRHVAKLRPGRFLFTFLREPVDRVISEYHFARTRTSTTMIANHSWSVVEASKAMTLKEFVLCGDPAVRMFIENFQTNTLASDIRPQYQGSEDDALGLALAHLKEFDFVGLSERLDESLSVLSNAIGMRPPLAVKRLNVNPERAASQPAGSEEIELIRRLNPLDIALYDAVKAKFGS